MSLTVKLIRLLQRTVEEGLIVVQKERHASVDCAWVYVVTIAIVSLGKFVTTRDAKVKLPTELSQRTSLFLGWKHIRFQTYTSLCFSDGCRNQGDCRSNEECANSRCACKKGFVMTANGCVGK